MRILKKHQAEALLSFTATNDPRTYLHGVYIRPSGYVASDGISYIEVTDTESTTAMIINMPLYSDKPETATKDTTMPAIIETAGLKNAVKACQKCSYPIFDNTIAIHETSNKNYTALVPQNDGKSATMINLDRERFKDERFVPYSGSVAELLEIDEDRSMIIDPDLLIKLGQAAKKLIGKKEGKHLTISINKSCNALAFRINDDAKGLLMGKIK